MNPHHAHVHRASNGTQHVRVHTTPTHCVDQLVKPALVTAIVIFSKRIGQYVVVRCVDATANTSPSSMLVYPSATDLQAMRALTKPYLNY